MNRRVSLRATSCLALLTVVHAVPSSVREYFDIGVAKDAAGEYDGAIDAFTKQCLRTYSARLEPCHPSPRNSLTGLAAASNLSPPQSRSRQRLA